MTKEYDESDFTDNKAKFNRKLIRAIPRETKRKRAMNEQEAIVNILEVGGTLITAFDNF